MKGGVILFIVEGPSDQDAITAFIANEVVKQNIRVTVKVMHGDILTKYSGYNKEFSVDSSNVKGEIKKLILEYLNSTTVKSSYIKINDIRKIYYMTDTDNCFLKTEAHSVNKKVEFEVIFFAHNLEHVIDENSNKLTDEEKEQIASDFAVESLNDRNYFIKTFTTSLMTWDSFKESYKGIKSYKDRACNINNLLNEIEEWKKN